MSAKLYRCEVQGVVFVAAESLSEARESVEQMAATSSDGLRIVDATVAVRRVKDVNALPTDEQEAEYFDTLTEEFEAVEFFPEEVDV